MAIKAPHRHGAGMAIQTEDDMANDRVISLSFWFKMDPDELTNNHPVQDPNGSHHDDATLCSTFTVVEGDTCAGTHTGTIPAQASKGYHFWSKGPNIYFGELNLPRDLGGCVNRAGFYSFYFGYQNGDAPYVDTMDIELPVDGEWHHFALAYGGQLATTMGFWVDGVLDHPISLPFPATYQNRCSKSFWARRQWGCYRRNDGPQPPDCDALDTFATLCPCVNLTHSDGIWDIDWLDNRGVLSDIFSFRYGQWITDITQWNGYHLTQRDVDLLYKSEMANMPLQIAPNALKYYLPLRGGQEPLYPREIGELNQFGPPAGSAPHPVDISRHKRQVTWSLTATENADDKQAGMKMQSQELGHL